MATLGYRAEIDAGRRFIESIEPDDTIVLLFHGDADGCCAGAIVYRTLKMMGNQLVFPVFMEKGETIYSEKLAKRILAHDPTHLIVMDTGSRTKAIVPGITTLVIDHHQTQGIPPVDVFVTSYGIVPPATASMLAYQVCRDLIQLDGLDWLAAVGTAGDMGIDVDVELLKKARDQYGASVIKDTVALINSARRSASYDLASAFGALVSADNPLDIVEGALPETAVLRKYRQEVNSELRRVIRTAPKISGRWALLQFKSAVLIHPLVAIAWTRRLSSNLVIAANYGYTEGKVHFSVRSAMDVNLLEELRKVRPVDPDVDFAHGHAQATGGILPVDEFKDFLKAIRYPASIADSVP